MSERRANIGDGQEEQLNAWGRFKQRLARVNPFVFMFLLFILVMLLPGEYSFWNQQKYSRQIREQKREIAYLEKEIEKSNEDLVELQYEKDMLEKYARERYLMKAEDEDLYLLR